MTSLHHPSSPATTFRRASKIAFLVAGIARHQGGALDSRRSRFSMSRFFGLALSLFALLLATSCASSRSGTQPPATTSHSFATCRAAARVSKSDTDVGLAIFRRLMHDARSDENPVVSPWGLGRAMDILYNGAAGKTKADMTRALHLDALDVEAVDGANEWLARNFTSAAGGVSIQSADTLWYETGLQLDPNFADRIATAFGVRLQSIDFANRNAAGPIDDWVRANSRGGNPAFTAPVDEFTRALLVDVLNMDGLWNKHFDPALTRPHEFTTASGRPVTVAMMKMTDSFAHAQGAGYQVVSIPYHGWQLSMDIILPEASSKGMRSVESVLRSTSLDNLLGRAPHARGTVEIPRFDVRFSANLNGPISQ